MNFNDSLRGGTAPALKNRSSIAGSGGAVRPKTRAVDNNDITEINIDLKNNRIRNGGGTGNYTMAMDSNLGGEFDQVRRSASRNRRAVIDPPRKPTNNIGPGTSALSAYTQNMANIVLNTSKKNQRSNSASVTSPRVVIKENRTNVNQLNDLRAAYGANILNGNAKPSSPNRPKTVNKPSTPAEEASESLPLSGMHSPVAEMVFIASTTSPVGSQDHVVTTNAAFAKLDLDNSDQQYATSNKASPTGLSLRRPQNDEDNNNNGSNNTTTSSPHGVARKSARKAGLARSKKSSDNLVDQANANTTTTTTTTKVGKSTRPSSPLLTAGISSSGSGKYPSETVQMAEAIAAAMSSQVTTPTTIVHETEDRIENYLDFCDNEVEALADGYDQRQIQQATANTIDNEDDDTRPRPQSRKLYLGTEKMAATRPSEPLGLVRSNSNGSSGNSHSKAPRSAGARYGSYNPIEDTHPPQLQETKQKSLRRLSSLDDVNRASRQQLWREEELSPNERPPSRQSSAFPVHLHPATDGNNSKGSSSSTTNSSSHENAGSSSGLSSRIKGVKVHSANYAMRSSVDSTTNTAASSSGYQPTMAALHAPKASAEVASSAELVLPTTELRSVRKSRGGTNSGNMGNLNSTSASSTAHDNHDGTDDVADEASASSKSPSKRPPSRQKPAAQHLFDDATAGKSLSHSRCNTAASRGGGERGAGNMTSSSSASKYDPKSDGFSELDPQDQSPFMIKVNYGHHHEGQGSHLKRDVLTAPQANTNESRPKTVNGMLKVGRLSGPTSTFFEEAGHHDTLRSMSANNAPNNNYPLTYRGREGTSNSTLGTIQMSSANHNAGNSSNSSAAALVAAAPAQPFHAKPSSALGTSSNRWTGEASDPRLIPRVQQKFALEADTGWTSPSFGLDGITRAQQDMDVFGDLDGDLSDEAKEYADGYDDNITIATEDSDDYGAMAMDMSIQSFQFDSSLGEDFLSLFAPSAPGSVLGGNSNKR